MRPTSILGIIFAHLCAPILAAAAQAILYSDTDCKGDFKLIYLNENTEGCFAFSGQSFSNLYVSSPAVHGQMTTWSGSNCEGFFAGFIAPNAENTECHNVPFTGAELLYIEV